MSTLSFKQRFLIVLLFIVFLLALGALAGLILSEQLLKKRPSAILPSTEAIPAPTETLTPTPYIIYVTATPRPTETLTPTPYIIYVTATPVPSIIDTPTASPSPTDTPTPSPTATLTPAPTKTATIKPTPTSTSTNTPSLTHTATATLTGTPSPTFMRTTTATSTKTATPVPISTTTPRHTYTPTPSPSLTSTASPTPTVILAATPSPTPTRISSRAKATPSLTPLPPDTVLLGLMSTHDYEDELGFIFIIGEVRNDVQVNVNRARITATFYNAQGEIIDEAAVSTLIGLLEPGQRSPFIISLPKPPEMWEYSLRATAYPTDAQPQGGLTIVKDRAYEDEAGFYHISGEVKNNGERPASFVQVVVSLYDKWGKIINAGFVYTQPPTIEPGEKASFDCSFAYYPWVKSYSVQVARD